MILLQLFYEFMKVGLFSIGGGLATLPFLYEMQEKTGWFTISDISNMVAVSESTPGPLGVNMATYVGYVIAKPFGGMIATLGLIFPSIVVITIISRFLKKFQDSKIVKDAMKALKAASVALISVAGVGVMQVAFLGAGKAESLAFVQDILWKNVLLAIAIIAIMKISKKSHPIFLIVIAGVAGFIFKM